jgi:hypothetical protein
MSAQPIFDGTMAGHRPDSQPFVQPAWHTALLLPAARAVLLCLVAWFCLLFAYCVLRRIAYPFELDWLEGEMACHVIRVLQGLPVYAPPSIDFVGEIYPPLYYYALAPLCALLGVSLPVLRIVSVVSCLAVALLLYAIQRTSGGCRTAGVVSTGFFIACYALHGPWYDVARLDMFFFLVLISACYLAAFHFASNAGLAGAILLFVLACYTKQSALVYAPVAGLWLLIQSWKRGLVFCTAVAGLVAAIFFALDSHTGGWFGTYTLFNPMRYSDTSALSMPNVYRDLILDIQSRLPSEMRYEICYRLPVFFTLAAGYLLLRFSTAAGRAGLSLWECTALASIIAYAMIRPHVGSEKNDFMYLTLWGSMLLGFLVRRCREWSLPPYRPAVLACLYALLSLQLVLLLYLPSGVLPAPGSAEKGRAFISRVRALPGEVFIPYHAYYGVMAGKRMLFNAGAFWGYQLLSPEPYYPAELIDMIRNQEFTEIIIDEISYATHMGRLFTFNNVALLLSHEEPLTLAIDEHYMIAERIEYESPEQFRCPTGFMTRPDLILRPRPSQ